MATIAIDVNDVVGMNATILKTLNEQFGENVTTAFISQYEKPHVRSDTGHPRPRLTTAQIAAALEHGKAESARLNASVTGHGDFTQERHERPSRTHDEVWADIQRIQTARTAAV